MTESSTLPRIRGSLLGGAVGDALGAGVEFLSLAEIRARYGPDGVTEFVPAYGRIGAITDDTQMTLFTAEGLIRALVRMRGKGICHPPSVIHRAYLRWLLTQGEVSAGEPTTRDGWLVGVDDLWHLRAPGATCMSALRSGSMGTVREPINDSKGCGGVMRIAPIGLVLDEPFDPAAEAAAITHGHPSGYLASGSLAVLLRRLVAGRTLRDAVEGALTALEDRPRADEARIALSAAIDLAAAGGAPTAELVESLGEGWVAEEALAISVYCALVATGFEHGVLLAVNHSGDSDSTGSITGQILGAALGFEAIPSRWLRPLEVRDEIDRIAHDLHRAFELGEDVDGGDYPGW